MHLRRRTIFNGGIHPHKNFDSLHLPPRLYAAKDKDLDLDSHGPRCCELDHIWHCGYPPVLACSVLLESNNSWGDLHRHRWILPFFLTTQHYNRHSHCSRTDPSSMEAAHFKAEEDRPDLRFRHWNPVRILPALTPHSDHGL